MKQNTTAGFIALRRRGSVRMYFGKARLGWCVPLLFALLVHAGRAATIVEQLEYANGASIATQNGGSGWAGAWSNQAGNGTMLVEEFSLATPGVATAGGKLHFTGIPATGTSTNVFRTFAAPWTTGDTYYISIAAQNLNDGQRFFGLALFNTTEQTLIGQGSTFSNWTLNHVAGFPAAILDSGVDSSAVAHLLVKLEMLDGVERITFWVNPDLWQPEDPSTAIGTGSFMTDTDFVSITRVRLGGGGFNVNGGDPTEHYIDEIRMSTDTPFVPEPSSATILCAAALGLCGRRHRTRAA